ncbi:hypothetical protein QYM36_012278 [Artemia franciscana]|uniref:Protein kinase domain-containing protein n=1 Tax=Artemia franciscana TaxID=6661 RepID=A0AA88HUJ1_ARTSF|nr:hypothetical protein QYM36_012278 [Artemia franciscana]
MNGVELQSSRAGATNTATDEEHSLSRKLEVNIWSGKVIYESTKVRSIAAREEETKYIATVDLKNGIIAGEFKQTERPIKGAKFQKEILNECEVLIIFQQIVSIVARLEECGIIHGDLKADNILIDGNFKVTLIDFDASTYMEEKIVKGALRFDNIYPPSELKGHHQRMKEKYNTHKYEFISESDKKIAEEMTRLYEIGPVTTWTLGAILAQLLLLEPIIFWESTDLKALESKISASSISPPVKNLLFMCLNQDPNKRPNTKEILEYLYLNLPYIINNKKEISKKLESERFSIKITANPKAEVEFFPARRSCA